MPNYEYSCKRCGQIFEVRQKFSDQPLVTHEGCGGEVERLVSAPALQFKGTGWYVTDYARNNNPPSGKGAENKSEAKADTKSEGKSDKSSDAKSDSKTEAKTESKPPKAPANDK
jgi:putative FmdB family regulatory protein